MTLQERALGAIRRWAERHKIKPIEDTKMQVTFQHPAEDIKFTFKLKVDNTIIGLEIIMESLRETQFVTMNNNKVINMFASNGRIKHKDNKGYYMYEAIKTLEKLKDE